MDYRGWFYNRDLKPVQDRENGTRYWKTDNLYTELEVLELLKQITSENVTK